MKLIQDNVQKRMELEEIYLQGKWYRKHVWNHVMAYEFARLALGIKSENSKQKNRLWIKFLSSRENVGSKKYIKLQRLLSEQNNVIAKFFEEINKAQDEYSFEGNQIFKITKNLAPFAVYAYELTE